MEVEVEKQVSALVEWDIALIFHFWKGADSPSGGLISTRAEDYGNAVWDIVCTSVLLFQSSTWALFTVAGCWIHVGCESHEVRRNAFQGLYARERCDVTSSRRHGVVTTDERLYVTSPHEVIDNVRARGRGETCR